MRECHCVLVFRCGHRTTIRYRKHIVKRVSRLREFAGRMETAETIGKCLSIFLCEARGRGISLEIKKSSKDP